MRMSYRLLLLCPIVLLFMAPRCGPRTYAVSIDTGIQLGPVNPKLFGNNVNWTENGWDMWNPAASDWYPASRAAIAELAPPFVRYPGGLLANFFHWAQALPDDRQLQPDTDGTLYMPHLGVFEFFTLTAEEGIEPIFTVNLTSGTPEEAAALVAYLNGATADTRALGIDTNGVDWRTVGHWAQRRTDHGRVAPFGVTHFELGNEQWLSAADGGLTAATYVARALAAEAAMKAVDPTVRTAVVGYQWLDRPGELDTAAGSTIPWNQTILEALEASATTTMEGIVQHVYSGSQGLTPESVYATEVLTDYVTVEEGLDLFEAQMLALAPSHPNLEIWFTEWNRGALLVSDHSLQDALWVADFGLNTLGVRSRIAFGNVYEMGNGGFGVFFSGNGIERPLGTVIRHPTFHALALLMRELAGERVQASVQSPRFSFPERGDPPKLRILAADDTAAGVLRLFIVNKASTALSLRISVSGMAPASQITLSTLTAASYAANNLDLASPDAVTVQQESRSVSWPLNLSVAGPGLTVLAVSHP